MSNPTHQMALVRFRIELYSAAQLMKDDELKDLKQLISELAMVLEVDRSSLPDTGRGTPATGG